MMRRTAGTARMRGLAQVALLPVGAFLVHQLRYLLAFGGNTSAVLRETGHSYLNSVVPWLVLLLALLVGGFLRSLGRAVAGQTTASRYTASLLGLWLITAACLLGIFIGQELLEGLLLTGHPAGWIGVFGYGGWWAVPAALIVGLVIAALFHGALWVLQEAASYAARRARPPAPGAAARPRIPRRTPLLPLAPLVAGWSGRGPPGI